MEGRTGNELQIKVLDYNILADSYHQIKRMRKLCARFEHRFPRIKKELLTSNADLLLLQEVDHQDLYFPFLQERMGY